MNTKLGGRKVLEGLQSHPLHLRVESKGGTLFRTRYKRHRITRLDELYDGLEVESENGTPGVIECYRPPY